MSHIGFESFILSTLCIGMTPFTSFFEVMWQSVILGPLRIIGSFYIRSFHKIIEECKQREEMEELDDNYE